MINIKKLHEEIIAAGIPIDGLNSDGKISFKPEATPDQILQANLMVKNFVDTPSSEDLRNGPNGYFPIQIQLKMIANDLKNGTQTLLDHINDVETRFPVNI